MVLYIAKAITAFVVVFLALVVGDDVAKGFDVSLLESAIVALLTSFGVWAVPNAGSRPGVRRVP